MSLWFISAAILPEMLAEVPISPTRQAFLSSAVQAGFVAGAILFALFAFADRYDPRRVLALCAVLAAAANAGLLIATPGGNAAIGLRFLTGALLAGEMTGHIFFKERWYGFDDAIYSAARLLEIIVNSEQSPADLFAALPGGVATPELHLDMPEEMHAEFMAAIMAAAQFPEAEITTLDGLRVDFADSWGLIRPSNTTPCLVLRFEGDDEAALEGVQERFRALIAGIDDSLPLPF